jgi:hypothetical protein
MIRGRPMARRKKKKSRTAVFDLTGIPVKELQRTKLGRRIIELAKRGKSKDISLIEDVLLERFSDES